ncbi:efflux transporter outer membrane subunit [Sphingomonas lenta]|uniref:Fis family transcriptional regulator n=1 Tax=Sphingomonas lenta TaxID=1141887 RepID=A0A2A2SFA5_9SPHN|nr:efflux transporter outer membrane subunit [Sphingomonas lenta]PAX07984.1 Fis family transcriptional regulator [Sphingomonas lenta]
MMRTIVVLALLTGACTLGPEPTKPDPRVGLSTPYANAADPSAANRLLPGDPGDRPEWWRTLRDPVLDRVIADALAGNLDLEIARARLAQARAQRRIAGAEGQPTVSASGRATRQRISENGIPIGGGGSQGGGQQPDQGGQPGQGGVGGGGQGAGGSPFSGLPGSTFEQYQVGFDASWELDLFGEARRGRQAAGARVEAAELAVADIRTSLAGELVRDYAAIREAQARLAVARANLDAARRTASITRERDRAGLATGLDVARAEAAVRGIAAAAPALEVQVRQGAQRLAVLSGREPGALLTLLETPRPAPLAPRTAALGLPSELLRRRPDIRQAERNLAAATYDVGGAVADLYPSFTINGSAGFQSTAPGSLFDWASRFFSLSGNLLAPLLDGGRRRGTVALRRAQVDEALARYRQTVLAAFQDVEDAVVAFDRDQDRLAEREAELAERERAVRIAREQDRAGLVTLAEVLDAERDRFAAADAAAAARGAVLADWAALQKALGGGWVPPPEPAYTEKH